MTIYADDVNYFKTGKSSTDSWMQKSKSEIENVGGKVLSELSGTVNGKSAFMISFTLNDNIFKVTFPVLPPRDRKDEYAAKRQAATAMYHDIKARCVSVKFHGAKVAFHAYLVLGGGRTASELSEPELREAIPTPFLLPPPR